MSQYILGKMLASSGKLFELMINNFEQATGSKALDLQLLGEVMAETSLHLRRLGLAPEDTQPAELVSALQNQFQNDVLELDRQVLGKKQDLKFFNKQLVRILNEILTQEVYCLSDRAIIEVLQKNLPLVTMKKLGVKHSDELLKKFNILELVSVAWSQESAQWRAELVAEVAKMPASLYQYRPIYFVSLNDKLAKLLGPKDDFVRNSLLGVVLLRPHEQRPEFGILDALIRGLLSAKKMIDESNQLQFLVLSENYSSLVSDWLLKQANVVWQLDAMLLPWRAVYRALAESEKLNKELKKLYPSLKLASLDISDELFDQFPSLQFWADTDFLAYRHNDQMISLSLLDLNDPAYRHFVYGVRTYFEEALWDELLKRYLSHSNLSARILLFLRSQVVGKARI